MAAVTVSGAWFAVRVKAAGVLAPLTVTEQPDDWQRFRYGSLLGASLAGRKKLSEAEPFLLEGYQGMRARKTRMAALDRYHLTLAGAWLDRLYRASGRSEHVTR